MFERLTTQMGNYMKGVYGSKLKQAASECAFVPLTRVPFWGWPILDPQPCGPLLNAQIFYGFVNTARCRWPLFGAT